MSTEVPADLLRGIKAIARFIGYSPRATQDLIASGEIPTFRLGRSVCARRSTLNRQFAKLEAAARARR